MQIAICAPNNKSRSERRRNATESAGPLFYRLQRTALAHCSRRKHPKQKRADQRQEESYQANTRIQTYYQMALGQLPANHTQDEARNKQPDCSAEQRHDHRLGQQLPNESPMARHRARHEAPVPGCDLPRARQTG